MMRGVGQRCSFYHNTHQRPHPAASSASSTSSNGSGSPPSSVHMGQLDSGYTTPSNMTNASVNTQETSASSASSTASTPTHGSTPASSPNTTAGGHAQQLMGSNLMLSMPVTSEALHNANSLSAQNYTTMPRHYMNQRQQLQQQQQITKPLKHPTSPQMAVLGNTGGTLQKVKRVYL